MKGTMKRARCGESISRADVKICELCGTLNLRGSAECFTCGWSGAFERESALIDAAWRSMEAEYGPLQREHVSGVHTPLLRGFEIAAIAADEPPPPKPWPSRIADWLWAR